MSLAPPLSPLRDCNSASYQGSQKILSQPRSLHFAPPLSNQDQVSQHGLNKKQRKRIWERWAISAIIKYSTWVPEPTLGSHGHPEDQSGKICGSTLGAERIRK